MLRPFCRRARTTTLNISATCLVITALLARLNYRFRGFPTSIGVMALSLPLGSERKTMVALTYSVVVSSMLAQRLFIGHVAR